MPFESEKQRRLCWAKYNEALKQGKKPKWDCHEFAKDTPKGLPQYKNTEASYINERTKAATSGASLSQSQKRQDYLNYIFNKYDTGKQDATNNTNLRKIETSHKLMSFPKHELSAYRKRLKNKLPTYTTRVSAEHGRYKKGQVVQSPLGVLHIDDVKSFNDGEVHPFHQELSPKQRKQIRGPFDVVKFFKKDSLMDFRSKAASSNTPLSNVQKRQDYLNYIFNKYDTGKQDATHGREHVESVRDIAKEIASRKNYKRVKLLEDAALLHDIGLVKDNDRALHHLLGAEVVAADPVISKMYKPRALKALVNAVKSHRASDKKYRPKSVLAKIISDADKIDGSGYARAYKFNVHHRPELNEKESLLQAANYMKKKFGPTGSGYTSLHFPESRQTISDKTKPLFDALSRKDLKLLRGLTRDKN